jgi:hypothetical protein
LLDSCLRPVLAVFSLFLAGGPVYMMLQHWAIIAGVTVTKMWERREEKVEEIVVMLELEGIV